MLYQKRRVLNFETPTEAFRHGERTLLGSEKENHDCYSA